MSLDTKQIERDIEVVYVRGGLALQSGEYLEWINQDVDGDYVLERTDSHLRDCSDLSTVRQIFQNFLDTHAIFESGDESIAVENDLIRNYMDDEIRDDIHNGKYGLAPLKSEQAFVDTYAELHKERFEEEFFIN